MASSIYYGVWTDWSQGRIRGATLTLSSQRAGFLIAFVAVFVAFSASQLWRLTCYILHQLRSTHRPRPRAYHRIQNVLRNSAAPGAGAWLFFEQVARKSIRGRRNCLSAISWLLFSIVFTVTFGLFAIFSSNISQVAQNRRLVQSSTCGFWSGDAIKLDAYEAKLNNDSYTAASYARACYGGNPLAFQCARLPVRELQYASKDNASCPFTPEICSYGNSAAFQVESKLIDSHSDLGINAPPEHRVQYQLLRTCSPINTTDYVYAYDATAEDAGGIPGDRVREYQFGPVVGGIDLARNPDLTTYVHNNHTLFSNKGYTLTAFLARSGINSEWTPVQGLTRSDADVSIFFLDAGSTKFQKSNNDPLFGANIEVRASTSDGGEYMYYIADKWITVMACAEQTRICNPNTNECSAYHSSYQQSGVLSKNSMNLNEEQLFTALRMYNTAMYTSLASQVTRRGAGALRAVETSNGILQAPLPDTQWMVEVSSWFEASLAQLQHLSFEFAAGPLDPSYREYIDRPDPQTSPLLFKQCTSQITGDPSDTVSFSVLGLSIILVLGGLSIIANQLAAWIVGKIQKKTGKGELRRRCWEADDLMMLQATALDNKTEHTSSRSLSGGGSHRYSDQVEHVELGRMHNGASSAAATMTRPIYDPTMGYQTSTPEGQALYDPPTPVYGGPQGDWKTYTFEHTTRSS